MEATITRMNTQRPGLMPPVARPARTADVVIVGGGVTGGSIAFHLAQEGVRDVLVLERQFLAAGGTGRSVGVIRQLYPSDTTRGWCSSLHVFQTSRRSRRRRSGIRPVRRSARGPRPAAPSREPEPNAGSASTELSSPTTRRDRAAHRPYAVGAAV